MGEQAHCPDCLEASISLSQDAYVTLMINCTLASSFCSRGLKSLWCLLKLFRVRLNISLQNTFLDDLTCSQLNRSARAGTQTHFGAWASILNVKEFEFADDSRCF